MTRTGVIVLLVVLTILVALVIPHVVLPLRLLWFLVGLLAGVVVARYV